MKTNNGIIVVNKPANYTSRDVVNVISKKLNTKKVGHTGTLDPLATGVLVISFGKYTKLVNYLTSNTKEYIGEIKLGIMTDTLDITGNILDTKDFKLQKEDIIEVLDSFIGSYLMEVPIYSAIKVNGKKLYQYAREKKEVKLPVKEVHIYDLELLNFKDDIIRFRAKVEKGTYIRSLIRDITKKLGTIGVMSSLIRIKQGKFSINNAYSLEDILNDNYEVLDVQDVLDDIKEYELKEEEYLKVKNGNEIRLEEEVSYLICNYKSERIAIYQKIGDKYKPFIML